MTEDKSKSRGRKNKSARFPVSSSLAEMLSGYMDFFLSLKERIQSERIKAVLAANSALVLLYWDIGNSILKRQKNEGWGQK